MVMADEQSVPGVRDGVRVDDGVPEVVPELEAVFVDVFVIDAVCVCVPVFDMEGVASLLGVIDGDAPILNEAVGVLDKVADGVVVLETDADKVRVDEGVSVAVHELVPVLVPVIVLLDVPESVGVGVNDFVGVTRGTAPVEKVVVLDALIVLVGEVVPVDVCVEV